MQTLFWNAAERVCFKFLGTQEDAAKLHKTICILVTESLNFKTNLLADCRNQSADELIGEPTPFNRQQEMQPWYFGTTASAIRLGFGNRRSRN